MTARRAAALLLVCAATGAQPPAHTATVTADRDRIKLWESVQVTLAVEGPAPLAGAVAVPERALADDADRHWRIRPKGAPAVTARPGGRERWEQAFRLDPIDPPVLGRPVRLAFNPVRVNGQPLPDALAVEVAVERTGAADAPLPEPLSVTAVEELPADTRPPEPRSGAVVAGVAGLLAIVAVFAVAWRRARRVRPLPPGEWARAALSELEAGRRDGLDVAERVADVLRRYVERRFAVPATKLTTGELHAALGDGGPPDAGSLCAVLGACDLAKFAGAAPVADAAAGLIRAAREWLDRAEPPTVKRRSR